jgi:hypothetical protein
MSNFIKKVVTNKKGEISSKIVIGGLSYVVILLAVVVIMFVNPQFPNLPDIINVLIVTSATLLGLTTVENVKHANK